MNPQQLLLPSGHKLAFDVYGDPSGEPAFYFHGWPSSRVQGELMHEAAVESGLCIVAMDRPGIGLSDHQACRRLRDWPAVIEALSSHLGWERFHLFGVSGGGPYVLVTAHAMPERILSAHAICGAPPLRLLGTSQMFWPYKLALLFHRHAPWMLGAAFGVAGAISRLRPDQAPLKWLMAGLSARDREAMSDEKTFRVIVESFRECLRSDISSVRADGDIYLEDWGFDLKDIRIPVHIWHGRLDCNIPFSYAVRVAAMMPSAIKHWTDDDGHYSLPVLRAREIAQTARQSRPG